MEDAATALTRAYAFAARNHAMQIRKGAKGEPYINHLCEVAEMLAQATGDTDPVLVLGGVLHDCLEGGGTTYVELAALFGDEVADLVAEVTDPEGAGEDERRRHQVESAPRLSARARLLKIADKASNQREIAADPPPDWSPADIRAYVQWGADVVAGCRGINWALESAFDAAHAQAIDSIGDG